jgi:hypothetical protein
MNWKTTTCGALGALGAYFATVTDPAWLPMIGKLLAGLSVLALGYFAKDKDVTGGTRSAD